MNYMKSACFRNKSPLETGTLAETSLRKTTFGGLITPDLKLLLLRFQIFSQKKFQEFDRMDIYSPVGKK